MVAFFSSVDWKDVFIPTKPILETFVRGTMVYVVLFLFLRLILKRHTTDISLSDLLVVVLIADAAQNAMADNYDSVPDGLLLVFTIIFWSHVLDLLGYRFPLVERLIHPPPLPLIKDGKMILRNMRREFITKEELMSQLREQGIEDLAKIKIAHMEGDGHISIIEK